jgi:HK97 family phage prohead protease
MEYQHKVLPLAEFKVATDASGTFEGRASTFGTIDSYGDRINPGAYKDTIPQFLDRGFIAWSHDWENPIAMVTSAEERDDGLWITGQFHGDAEAQKFRQRVRERLDADKFMGLSIGYVPEEFHYEEEGAVRVLDQIKLYEVSLVTVPAEANSQVTSIKGHGVDFDEHTSQVRAALDEWVARCKAGSAERVKAGRELSQERRSLMETVSGSLRGHADEIDELLSTPLPSQSEQIAPDAFVEPAPADEVKSELIQMRDRFLAESAYYAGVPERDRFNGLTG